MKAVKTEKLSPADRVRDLEGMREAMGRGVREALRRHKQAGNPVATWQDGAVVWVAPEDIPVDDDEEALSSTNRPSTKV